MTDAASLLDAQPVFPSSDLSRTEIFYTEKLGFAVGDRHADWLKLDRDGLTLHFSGELNWSTQHEPRMEVSWCEDVARA